MFQTNQKQALWQFWLFNCIRLHEFLYDTFIDSFEILVYHHMKIEKKMNIYEKLIHVSNSIKLFRNIHGHFIYLIHQSEGTSGSRYFRPRFYSLFIIQDILLLNYTLPEQFPYSVKFSEHFQIHIFIYIFFSFNYHSFDRKTHYDNYDNFTPNIKRKTIDFRTIAHHLCYKK